VSISPNFLTNLKTNEGYRNDVYRDSLGVLTAGVGHKLTNAELGQYKEGDTIDDALISKWLDQDSTKAYTAATQQANQLGQGGNSNFIDALGEVNFQLGTKWYKDHQNTWGLMQQGNFSGAATEAAVSNWNDQTPKRVQNFQAALQQLQADQPEPIELPTAQTEPTQPQRGPIANLFDVGDPFAPNTKAIEAVSGAFAGERVEGLGDAQGQLSLGETFGEAVRAGGKQFESDVYTFGAIGNLLTGNDEAARAKLGKAKILDDSASEILSQMGAFEEFYDAPTFSGFVEQVVKGVGSFTPMAMTSVISAGVGGIVANLGKGGVTFASRAFLKKKFNTIARKEKNDIKLTAAEAEFVENGYNAAKAARTYTSTTATKIGMGVGAFGQEYVVGSSQALKEYDDAGFELTKEEAKMAAALGIPQALLGTLSEGLFFRSMTKMALKDAVGGDMAAGAFMKELAKAVAIKSGQSFVVEGVTETLQEGTLVAQRFAIDPNYSAQEAKMRIMESAFVGAFAGGARAAPTSVIAKAYNLLSTGREVQADLNQEESQQVLDGRTQVEPDADLIAQIDDLVNPEAERQAVVLENTTKEQAIEIVKNIWGTARTAELQKIEKDHAEEVAKVNNDVSLSPAEKGKKLRRLDKVKEIAIKRAKDEAPKTTIKDVDILVDEEKGSVAIVNAENATTIEQEMLQRGGLTEEYKQELLGFSQPQNIDDEIVFVVKDKNGNHVFTQSTNKAGEKVAEKNVRDRYKKELAAGKVTVTKGDKAQIGEEKQARLNKEQEAKKGPEKATVKDVVDDNDPAYTENDDPTYETAGQTEFGQNLGRTLQESEMGKEISEGQAIEEGFSASSREANNLELAGKNAKSPYGRVLALSSYTNQETAARNKANEQEKATFLNALDSDADRSFWTSYVDGVQRIDDVPKGTLKNFTDISEKNQNTTYILSEVPAIDKEGNPIEGQKAYQVLADLSQEQEGFERAVQKATQASYRQQRAEINDSPEARAFTIEIPAVDEKGKLIEGKTTSPAVDIITLINYAIYQADLDASSTSIATDSALSPAERNRQGFKELVAIAEELGRPLYYKGKRVVSMTDAELNAVQISSFKKQGDKFILNKAGSVEVGVPIKKEPVSNKALNTIINSDIKQIVGSLTGVEGTLEQLAFDIGSGNTLEQQVPVYEKNKDGTNKVDNKGNPIPKLNNAGEPIFKTERTTSGANTVQNIVTGADMKVRRQEIVFITNESKLNREKPFGRYEGYTREIFENEFKQARGFQSEVILEKTGTTKKGEEKTIKKPFYSFTQGYISERQYLKQFQEYLQDIAQEEGIFTDSEAASLNEETTVETTERTEDQRQQESAIRGEDLGQFGYENHINALNANSAKIGKTYLSTQKQRGVENKRTSATQRVKDYFKRENLFGDFAGAKGDSIVDVLLNAINTQLKYGRTLRIISLDDDIVLGSEFNDIYVDEKGVRRNAKWIVENIKEDMRKTGKPARIVEFGAQGDVIILNLQQKPTDEQFAFMLRALGHEIGHGVYKHELERSLEIPQLKKLLDNAFAKAKKALQEAVGVDENGRQKLTKYDGEIGFEEWYADQYSVYALDPDQKATNFVQSYFKRIIQRLKKFFDIVNKQAKGRFTLDPDFVSYMNGVQQVANISPPGNKRTTFNNFTRDQKAEVYRVLDVMEQTVDTPKGVSRQALGFIKRQVEALLRAPLPLLPTDKKHISLNFVFKTAHGYLKEISPALAAIMYSESQSEDKSGYINVRILVINQKLNQIYSLVPKKKNGEPNIEALTRIAEEAEASTPTAELGPEARQMREFLSEFYDTYIDGNLEGVLKLPNFFPRKWSLAELRQSPEKRAIMAKLLRKYNPDVKQITDGNATTYEDWESYVKSWLETDQDNESIAKTDNGISSLSLGMDQARVKYFKAIPTEAARRGLNEQGEINPEGSKDIELINPAAYSLKAYIEDTVKRVEYDKRAQATATKADWYNIKRDLGENEANRIATSIANKNLAAKKTGTKAKFNKEEEAFLKIGYNASKIQLGEKAANVIVGNINAKDFKNPDLTGWKATEVLLARIEGKNDRVGARRAMEAMLGRVGLGMSGWARQVNSWGLLTNMMTLLAFTTLASLPDLAGPILRSKGMNNFGQTMDQLKYYFKNREAAEQFAKDLGVITHDSLETMYINAAELGFMTKETKFLANKFFKVIGLDFFTKFTRVFAAGMGEQFLINLAKTNDADSNRYLRELDLTREEVLAWSKSENKRDFSGPEGAKIKAAVGRFVEESIVRPSAAERPVWASNPYTALIWQLKSFFYAYGKNIIGGAIREAKNRHAKDGSIPSAALPLILGAVTLLPLTALGLEIREFIKYLVRGGDAAAFRSDNMPWGEYFLEMLDRSGVLGAYGLIYGMMQANKYGNSWFVNGLGPTAERVENLWQGNAKLKDYNPFSI
jgi:lysozyme